MAISKTKLTELDEARSLQLQALRVRLDRFGPDSLDVAASRESIAVTLGNMKLWDEAVEHSSEALDALTRKLGAENEATLRCRANRAMCL